METLKRFIFLDYCVAMMVNPGSAAVARLDGLGVPRDAVIALESDFEWLARGLLGMKPKLSAEQIATLARIVGFLASDGPSSFTMKNLTFAITPLLCEDGPGKEIRQAALERLFHRLGEGQLLTGYPDSGVMQLIEALARATGIPPETHPILRAKLAAAALATESQQAVVKLAGPRLAPFFETAFKENVFGSYQRNYVKDRADMSAIEALSPRDRALALFDCLRVFNFMSHWGAARYAKAWPEAKLTSFASADYPRMSEYSEQSHSWMILGELFQQMARRKLDLDDDMLSELLRVLHSNAAEHTRAVAAGREDRRDFCEGKQLGARARRARSDDRVAEGHRRPLHEEIRCGCAAPAREGARFDGRRRITGECECRAAASAGSAGAGRVRTPRRPADA